MTDRNFEPGNDDFPAALRLQLRNRRRDAMPATDLWPGIASRIAGPRPAARPDPLRERPAAGVPRIGSLAIAASLVLALALGWQLRLDTVTDPAPGGNAPSPLLLRQASALDREYQAALQEAQAARPGTADEAALGVLDRSAAQIHDALERNPHSEFLLDQLGNVYRQRLELTLALPRTP
ncbi:hypothetical protein [Luteimonas vadosa]|uniref:Uncharacterized protein n=1 Tax=Luteimonas vadosa TaxID=1165507 RepID=A0ABP9E2G2_9GAMM